MTDPICVFALGACLLHGPLNPEARIGQRLRYPRYGRVPGVYTFGEMFQVIDVLRGERDIPHEIHPLCGIKGNFNPVAAAADFRDVDVVLVEPASPIDITLRGCNLNRAALSQAIEPLRNVGREGAKHLNRWFRIGLMDVNETARAEAVDALMPLVGDELPDAELIRTILLETRSASTDVSTALARLQSELGRPMGVVNYIFQYMPDGRAISWPAGFHEQISEQTQRLDLPLFRSSLLVNKYGVDFALRPDLRHYKDEFMPIVADALIEFATEIQQRAAPLPQRVTG